MLYYVRFFLRRTFNGDRINAEILGLYGYDHRNGDLGIRFFSTKQRDAICRSGTLCGFTIHHRRICAHPRLHGV